MKEFLGTCSDKKMSFVISGSNVKASRNGNQKESPAEDSLVSA